VLWVRGVILKRELKVAFKFFEIFEFEFLIILMSFGGGFVV
jgi:hypothetical protein